MSSTTINQENVSKSTGKVKNISLWVVQILLAGMFLMAGSSKLSGNEQMINSFAQLGFGQWFRYLTGAIEVVAAILLLVPKFSGLGALLLIPTMIGAIAAHAFILGGGFTPALVLLILSVVVAIGRKDQIIDLLNSITNKN